HALRPLQFLFASILRSARQSGGSDSLGPPQRYSLHRSSPSRQRFPRCPQIETLHRSPCKLRIASPLMNHAPHGISSLPLTQVPYSSASTLSTSVADTDISSPSSGSCRFAAH